MPQVEDSAILKKKPNGGKQYAQELWTQDLDVPLPVLIVGTYDENGNPNAMNAAWSMGIDSRWIHRAEEAFESEEGKALLNKWGIEEDVEGIGFCILGHAEEEKPKTEIIPGRVFYV